MIQYTTSDAGNNHQSGPLARAFQLIMFIPMLLLLLPFALMLNLAAWVRGNTVGGGIGRLAERKTLPMDNDFRRVMSKARVLNAVTLLERTLDPSKAEEVFWRYIERNGFSRKEVAFEVRRNGAERPTIDIYRELFHERSPQLLKIILCPSMSRTVVCGLFDFGVFDGTSCFNFSKGFLAAYFDEELPHNRPGTGGGLELKLAPSVQSKLSPVYTLGVALREAWSFGRSAARWLLSREGWDVRIPPQVSLAQATIDASSVHAMLDRLRSHGEPVKPFAHLMRCSAMAIAAQEDRGRVALLTQISCQARFYEPKLPRNQVGYWLIGRSSSHRMTDLQDAAFCANYYRALSHELAHFEGGLRHAFARQAMLGGGGTGHLINARQLFWFNNYGIRDMTTSAGRLTYHWSPNFKLSCYAMVNVVTVNGELCITLGSTTMSQQQTDTALRTMVELLRQGGTTRS